MEIRSLTDEEFRKKYTDDIRAQAAQFDLLVRDLEAIACATADDAKTVLKATAELRRRRPDFEGHINLITNGVAAKTDAPIQAGGSSEPASVNPTNIGEL